MTSALGPTVRRRRLGTELNRLREAAGLTTREAATVLECSVAKIGHIERGRYGIRKAELMLLLDAYGAPAEVRDVLEEIRREASQRGWWATYRLPVWARPFIGLESDAASVRTFEVELVPGLLQTEGYALAVETAARHVTSPEQAGLYVAARMQRQRRLTEPVPLELWAVVSEAAIHRVVGGPKVMAEQLEHLVEMGKLPNVKLQVLPFDAGAHGCMAGSVTLLSFPDQADPDVAYLEYALGGSMVEEGDAVARLALVFDDLRALAMTPRDSAALIARLSAELDKDDGKDG